MTVRAPAGTLKRNWPDELVRTAPPPPRTSTLTPFSGVELPASVMGPVGVPVWAHTGPGKGGDKPHNPPEAPLNRRPIFAPYGARECIHGCSAPRREAGEAQPVESLTSQQTRPGGGGGRLTANVLRPAGAIGE